MTLDTVERIVRTAGLFVVVVAWLEAGRGMRTAAGRRAGAVSGAARSIGILPAYALVAVPYFAVCVVLWRPIGVEISHGARIAALAVGFPVGLAGAGLYLWGRRTLGTMYNVTGTLGAQVFEGHRLVAAGPYRRVRHPMYLGIVVGALGGLAVYRTWTFVFVIAMAPGVVLRARSEDRLLAAVLGERFEAYRAAVPGWLPAFGSGRSLPGRRDPGESAGAAARLGGMLAPNTTAAGRAVRGLVVAPAAGWVLVGSGWPLAVRIGAGVVGALSVISALTGHCFARDLVGLLGRGRPQAG